MDCPSVPEVNPRALEVLEQTQRAALKGELALLSTRRASDFEPVVLLCRIWREDDQWRIYALAEVPKGDPGELYVEPEENSECYRPSP